VKSLISQTVRYAFRILGYLADHPGEWIPGEQIAKETGIPANYLSKILNQLRKRGFVQSQKGWGGGFLLEKSAMNTPISEVVELLDGRVKPQECIFGFDTCDLENPCPLHPHWEKITGTMGEMLDTVTIADLYAVSRREEK
jgi:Rrf2 family iron-sulfur cluster assembly transcriptional regulator